MCPGWPHSWHVMTGHAVKEWLAGLPTLVQIAHIGPLPPPLLPLPAPRRPPKAVCAPPPQPACEGGLYAGPPPQLDWWVELYHGEVGAVCCHVNMDWYESFPPRARWSLSSYMARFFEAAAAGVCVALILCVNQSAVSLGWFWAITRSCPMTRSATTSRSPSSWEDLDARRSY